MKHLLAIALLATSLAAQNPAGTVSTTPLSKATIVTEGLALKDAEIAALREQVELLNAMLQVFQARAMPAALAFAKIKADSETTKEKAK